MSAADAEEPASYLITLRTLNAPGPSLLNRRLISLHPGETAILGRVSKSHKMDFVAKSTNGYYDNPIISRCHAVLENRSGKIYIADKTSTHGTYLNGIKLLPEHPVKLITGDTVRLGSPIETADSGGHNPTELELAFLAMQTPDTPDDQAVHEKSAVHETSTVYEKYIHETSAPLGGPNSFHAPEESDEDADERASRGTWRPFAPATGTAKEFPRPGEVLAVPANQMGGLASLLNFDDAPKRDGAGMSGKNPWVMGETLTGSYNFDGGDQEAYYSDEDEEEEDDKDSLSDLSDVDDSEFYNGFMDGDDDNDVAETNVTTVTAETQVPETQVANQITVTETLAVDTLATEGSNDERKLQYMESWESVKTYLDSEVMASSDEDEDYMSSSEDEDEDEYDSEIDMDEYEEEEEEEEDGDELDFVSYYDIFSHSYSWDEEDHSREPTFGSDSLPAVTSQTLVPKIRTPVPETRVPETRVPETQPPPPEVVAESVPEPKTPTSTTAIPSTESLLVSPAPAAQTHTPPITPQYTASKKRPHPEDTESAPHSVSPIPDSPIGTAAPAPPPPRPYVPATASPLRKIAPLPSRSTPPPSDTPAQTPQLDDLTRQNESLESLNTDLARSAKRRRTETGWTDVAKTVGKYSVAGIIGGIATVVGLAWSAGS